MDTSYEILGLAPDASQEEIKKAYFKMVRRYSPESDPQQFQIIRRAYEQLKKGPQDKPELPVFPALTDPLAIEMMQQVQAFRKTFRCIWNPVKKHGAVSRSMCSFYTCSSWHSARARKPEKR